MIKTHKKTNQRLLLKNDRGLVCTLFALDKNDNKIKDGYNIYGNSYFKIVICLSKNLI